MSSDVIEVYLDRSARWRWRRKAANHEIVADSGYGYTRKYDALKAAITRNVDVQDVVEIDPRTGHKQTTSSVLWPHGP